MLPGIHLRELHRILGMSFSSTRYHVDKLCDSGEIVQEKGRGHLRLYPAGLEDRDKAVYSFLRLKRSREILTALAQRSNITSKEICFRTGLTKSTVSKTVHELAEAGLVKRHFSKSEGATTYEISEPDYILRVLINAQHPSGARRADPLLDSPSDKFVLSSDD